MCCRSLLKQGKTVGKTVDAAIQTANLCLEQSFYIFNQSIDVNKLGSNKISDLIFCQNGRQVVEGLLNFSVNLIGKLLTVQDSCFHIGNFGSKACDRSEIGFESVYSSIAEVFCHDVGNITFKIIKVILGKQTKSLIIINTEFVFNSRFDKVY